MSDENYISGAVWQYRMSYDRRFWNTSGGWPCAVLGGIVDDYGDIVNTEYQILRCRYG